MENQTNRVVVTVASNKAGSTNINFNCIASNMHQARQKAQAAYPRRSVVCEGQ